jgi:hypothetical protein
MILLSIWPVAAILSSNEDIPVNFVLQEKGFVWGNRPVNRVPTHPRSRKLGFDHFLSKYNKISLKILA